VQTVAAKALDATHEFAAQVAARGEEVLTEGYQHYTAASRVIDEVVDEAYRGLPEESRKSIEDRRRYADQTREHAKELALSLSKPIRHQVFVSAGQVLRKKSTSDPDMWAWARRVLGIVVDGIWNDIEVEVERGLETGVFTDLGELDPHLPSPSSLMMACGYRLRAFVLYHFLPYDRSIFGMLKDPVYLAFLALTLSPFFSLRVAFYTIVLALLAISPDGIDEYQLVSFILSSKGMQFMTGVLLNTYGAGQYYYAIHYCNLVQACIHAHTPGDGEPTVFALVDYFGSVVLVWVAFFMLPRSSKHGLNASRAEVRKSAAPELLKRGRSESVAIGQQGGRLLGLLKWDLGAFSICTLGLVILQAHARSEIESSEFLADLFWMRVLYSMLSVPFFFFTLPGIRQLLTHAEPTGFSPWGKCMPFQYRGDKASLRQPLLQPSE